MPPLRLQTQKGSEHTIQMCEIDQSNERKIIMKIERVHTNHDKNTWKKEDRVVDYLSKQLTNDQLSNHFCFWEVDMTMPPELDAKDFVETFKIHGKKVDQGRYIPRISKFAGHDLEHVLYSKSVCRNCVVDREDIKTRGNMLITGEHAKRMIKHMAIGCKMLRDVGINHNDLALRNFIIHPTQEELKQNTLTESLPRIIDFGLSTFISEDDFSTVDITQDFKDLFTSCRHKLSMLMTLEGHKCWLHEAIVEKDRASCEELINILENPPDSFSLDDMIQLCN